MNAKDPNLIHHPNESELLPEAIPVLGEVDRWILAGLSLGIFVVFLIAFWLRPYQEDGQPLTVETHRQLGLPPCNFYALTGYPCPACGMTTSFSLLIHGDPINSLRANWVGTLLATLGLIFIPWSLACIRYRQTYWIRSIDRAMMFLLITFMTLLVVRWVIVVLLIWLRGGPATH